ncbi:sugar ABC transporter ATP-binding protein [Nocardioides sp. NPDC101246]|uniref:sugar ABC transporter ATP-binding protein n=1 Tax=Nocardioides sp. NPDC101246 TaxID=3364336 RepID=UPI00380EC2B5
MSAEMSGGDPLLRVTSLVKDFPGLRALDDVSLEVRSGEVVAVLGHNGSGKSTLVKVLAGRYAADGGTVELPASAGEEAAELHFIHQDLALVGALTAVENLNLIGSARLHPHDSRAERRRATELVARFGEGFDVTVPVASLTPGQRAIVAIARALDGWTHPRNVLVLDEPTESLHGAEVEVLFSAVRRLAAEGAGVMFISHRLDEVLALADRVVVLRDGRVVAAEPVDGLDHDRLVELITGATPAEIEAHQPQDVRSTDPVLSVRGLRGGAIENLDLDLHAGEVVGVAGVLGSGREAVPSLLFGAVPSHAGTFTVGGAVVLAPTPATSIRRKVAFVPGDRARHGSTAQMSARENLTLPQMRTVRGAGGAISTRRERAEAERRLAAYDVRPHRTEQRFGLFSGGNQQKIVLARWLRDDPLVLLLDEPTQGVDIGAKTTIYEAVGQAAANGTAVLVSSSDTKELLRICDRVLVLRDGRLVAELAGDALTEHRLLVEGYGLTPDNPEIQKNQGPS